MSQFTYDGEGEVDLPEYLEALYEFIEDAYEFDVEEVSVVLPYTLHESPRQWLCSIPAINVH